jgi:hypothetical protein
VLQVKKGKTIQETQLTYYKVALRNSLHGSDSWKINEEYINGKQITKMRYVRTDGD